MKPNTKKNIPGAIEKAKQIVKLSQEALDESKRLLLSLELENAIPDIWDHGGSFKIGDTINRKVAFEYKDGTTRWIPLADLPTSYLESINKEHKHRNRHTQIVRATDHEIFKRRKAKRDEANLKRAEELKK